MGFDREAYAARIKSLRKNRKLTQEQLAERMNVSGTYIAKIENGKQTGSVELTVDFSEFFDIPLDYLLLGKGYQASDRKSGLRMVIAFLSELEETL